MVVRLTAMVLSTNLNIKRRISRITIGKHIPAINIPPSKLGTANPEKSNARKTRPRQVNSSPSLPIHL